MSEGQQGDQVHELRRDIGLKINVVTRMLRNRFDRMVAALNITRSQWTMIVVVARQPGATQRSIAEALDMSEASAGRLIDKLCSEGLLERQERYDDRRARAVYITKAAEPLLDKLAEVARSGEDSVFKGFTIDELENFKNYLDRLYRNIS
mgnify:CR=1 FL=1